MEAESGLVVHGFEQSAYCRCRHGGGHAVTSAALRHGEAVDLAASVEAVSNPFVAEIFSFLSHFAVGHC